jgi:hypothetical protein
MNQRATRARTASSLSRVSCDPLDQNNDFTLDVEKSKVPAVAMSELGFDGSQEKDELKNLARLSPRPTPHSPDEPKPSRFPGAPSTIYGSADPVN